MAFDGTKPNLAQTYGDAVLSAQANDFDLNSRVVAHVNDSATAHGLASILTNVADYFLHKGNTTDAHGLASVLSNVAAVMAEVAAGRGSQSTLALRLASAINADGSIRLSTLNNKWINNADTPTYISTTSFSVPGDRTAVYIAGVQCRFMISGSYAYAPVASRSFSAGVTTVVIDPAYPILTAGVSAVDIGLIAWDNSVALAATANAANITSVQGQVTGLKVEPISGWIGGKPGAGAVIHRLIASRAFSIPSLIAGAVGKAVVPGTAAATFTLSKISQGLTVAFGTMDFVQQRTNLLIYSGQLDNAAWPKSTGVTVTPNAVTAPDGTSTADALVYDGSGTSGGMRIYGGSLTSVNGATYTASIWLRAASAVTVRIGGNVVAGAQVTCNLTTSWQRFSTTGTGNGVSPLQLLIYSPSAVNTAFTIYAWGAQIEEAASAGEYIPTTSAPVSKGFTNLALYSEQFDNAVWGKNTGVTVTANTVTAPDGTLTADSVVYDGSGVSAGWRFFQGFFTSVPGVVYMGSIWLRASAAVTLRLNNNLAGGFNTINVTTSWQRFSTTGPGDGTSGLQLAVYGSANETFTLYAWGAQTEVSPVATDYIPTTSAPVTRLGAVASFNAATATSFAAGDMLVITAPASQDATLADIAFTIPGVLP